MKISRFPLLPEVLCLVAACFAPPAFAEAPAGAVPQADPPYDYLPGKAYHILSRTTTDESGYSSLCEGLNGRIYAGTAAYGRNAYLVEFDPETEKQRVVIDMQDLIGTPASGMKTQSKIHTRNYVGASGTIYVGSKQGYPAKGENPFDFPHGYLAKYDPRTDEASLISAVPFRGHGVIDVNVDEARGIIYVCTQDDRNRQGLWMRYDMGSGEWRGLYSNLTFYGLTLRDRTGRTHAITDRNEIVSYDPETKDLVVRPMVLDGEVFTNAGERHDGARGVPNWILAPDGRTAYLVYMSEPTLYRIDLLQTGESVMLESLGKMLDVERSDSRTGLTVHPEGGVYCMLRVKNPKEFGGRNVHHIVNYRPATGRMIDLGVAKIENPMFYGRTLSSRGAVDNEGERIKWTHGFHVLPDGTLTPTTVHQALIATREGGLYALLLYPYTLFRVDPQTVVQAKQRERATTEQEPQ